MDFAKAALLIAAVLGIVTLVKNAVYGDKKTRVTVLIVSVCALAAVFLVGATTWADSQVIGDVSMKAMSVPDKILVAVFVAGAASAAWETLGAIKNVGVPVPSKAQQDALDTGAVKSLERWANLADVHGETPQP